MMFQVTISRRRWVGLIVLMVSALYLLSATVGAAASLRHTASGCSSASSEFMQHYDSTSQPHTHANDSAPTQQDDAPSGTHLGCCGVVCHSAAAMLPVSDFTEFVNEIIEPILGIERPIIRNLDRLDRPPKSLISH